MADNIAVKDAAGSNVTLRTTDSGTAHTPHHIVSSFPGYDAQDDMVKMKSVQKKFRDSFSGASLDTTKWDSTTGSGASITQSGGALTLASGTTANSETFIQSKETFTIPFRVVIGLTLSQRIANQTFWVEAVSVNATTGVPDGNHCVAWRFDGTTATNAIYEVQNGGLARLASAASTIVTTASGGVYELEPFADEAWFHSGTLDATTGRANSYRRHQQIPDPNAVFKIRLRWLNGATPPASSTNAVVQFLAVQDYAELTAEITAGRGNAVAGTALGVQLTTAIPAGTALIGNVGGQAAHDAVLAGNPVRIGARALNAAYATVATGDQADLISTLQGVLVTRPWQIPELEWSYAAAAGGILNTTTAVAFRAAPAAGLRSYVTGVQIMSEALTTATELAIRDGAGGTVLWRTRIPTGGLPTTNIEFPNPIKGTVATLLEVVTLTASGAGAVYFNAQGFTAA